MSTEQEDAAMLLELQDKITRRIREQIRLAVDGMDSNAAMYSDTSLTPPVMRGMLVNVIKAELLSDSMFLKALTSKIGKTMMDVG